MARSGASAAVLARARATAAANREQRRAGGLDPMASDGSGDGGSIVDPADLAGDAGSIDSGSGSASSGEPVTGEPTRTRRAYTRRGDNDGRKTKALPASIDGITDLLVGIHFSLQTMTGAAEWQLSQEEGKTLARAYNDMTRHYNMPVSGKTLDTMRFIMVATTVYGTRMYRMRARHAAEKSAKTSPQPPASSGASSGASATVVQMKPSGVSTVSKPAQDDPLSFGHFTLDADET